MSRKQDARDTLRSQWGQILTSILPSAIEAAQIEINASQRLNDLWPEFPIDELMLWQKHDGSYLLRRTSVDRPILERYFADKALEFIDSNLRRTGGDWHTNRYLANDAQCRRLIEDSANFLWDKILRACDNVYDAAGTDRIAHGRDISDCLLQMFVDRFAEFYRNPTNDMGLLLRHSKLLTALTSYPGTSKQRLELLSRLETGRTCEFPYVVRQVTPGEQPIVKTFRQSHEPKLAGFTDELTQALPAAQLVRRAYESFRDSNGVLLHYIEADAPLLEELQQQFDQLPSHVPRQRGGIHMPREEALQRNRRDRFSMPDGVVSSVSLVILLEWLLHQVAIARNLDVGQRAHGRRVANVLLENELISEATHELIATVFDRDHLCIRSAVSHGAFYADDRAMLERTIHGLLHTLAAITQDLQDKGIYAEVLDFARWDAGHQPTEAHLDTIRDQFQPGLNLLDQLLDDDARSHVFRVLDRLTPDKALAGKAAFLLWIGGQRDEHTGDGLDENELFTGLIAALTVLEELFRAVSEIHGLSSVRVAACGESSVRCEMIFFDDTVGNLLEPDRLAALFPDENAQPAFHESVAAVRAIRDLLYHGRWNALLAEPAALLHLNVKLLFALCSTVNFESQIATQVVDHAD